MIHVLDEARAGRGRLVLCTGEAGIGKTRAAGFLVAGDRPGDYRFSHALVRSAVVAGLSAADRLRWDSKAQAERFRAEQLFPRSGRSA